MSPHDRKSSATPSASQKDADPIVGRGGAPPASNLNSLSKALPPDTLVTGQNPMGLFRVVKAMVFPVVMYRYDSWTVKKAEHLRIDAFKLYCWRRFL